MAAMAASAIEAPMKESMKKAMAEALFILENSDADLSRIAPDYLKLMRKCRAEYPAIDIPTDVPIEDQQLSEDTRNYLATLYLSFFCNSEEEQLRMVERMCRNELCYQGKDPDVPLDEEFLRSELKACLLY